MCSVGARRRFQLKGAPPCSSTVYFSAVHPDKKKHKLSGTSGDDPWAAEGTSSGWLRLPESTPQVCHKLSCADPALLISIHDEGDVLWCFLLPVPSFIYARFLCDIESEIGAPQTRCRRSNDVGFDSARIILIRPSTPRNSRAPLLRRISDLINHNGAVFCAN